MTPPATKTVYSTDKGRLCPKCGWPEKDCRCSSNLEQEVPAKIVVVLRLEKAGRGGKAVTVIDELPRNRAFVESLAGELKKALGTGGKAADGKVEIQGEHREAIRSRLQAKGWRVKG